MRGSEAIRDHSGPTGLIVEAVAGAVMLVAGFSAIAASDVSASGSRIYCTVLVVAFGAAALAAEWLYSGHTAMDTRTATRIVLHWFGVFVTIQLVYYFVASGRFANADTGLANGLILALGTFLAGVHGTWRLVVIGIALAVAAAAVAFVEEYLWVLFAVAILAIVALAFGARLIHRRS
jgi:hypothetical protein